MCAKRVHACSNGSGADKRQACGLSDVKSLLNTISFSISSIIIFAAVFIG